MLFKGKFLLLTQIAIQIFSKSIKTIDDDSFDLYDENLDNDFEETSLDGNENNEENVEQNQASNDDSQDSLTNRDQDEKPHAQADSTQQKSEDVVPPKKRDEEQEVAKKAIHEEKNSQEKQVRQDFHIIVCLAMYSKSAMDKMKFQNDLETQFGKVGITDIDTKSKLVERYVVSAIHNCKFRTKSMEFEKLQNMMRDIYQDLLSIEIIKGYVVFDENIIINQEDEMTAEERITAEEMKRIQKEHGGDKEQQNQGRQSSMTESYGEWSMLIISVIVGCVIYYMLSGNSKEAVTEGKIKADIRDFKKQRKTLVDEEKLKKKEIQDLKNELNKKKKGK